MTQIRTMPTKRGAAVLAWVPVTGADGRVRMQMRWHVGEAPLRHPLRRTAAA